MGVGASGHPLGLCRGGGLAALSAVDTWVWGGGGAWVLGMGFISPATPEFTNFRARHTHAALPEAEPEVVEAPTV